MYKNDFTLKFFKKKMAKQKSVLSYKRLPETRIDRPNERSLASIVGKGICNIHNSLYTLED